MGDLRHSLLSAVMPLPEMGLPLYLCCFQSLAGIHLRGRWLWCQRSDGFQSTAVRGHWSIVLPAIEDLRGTLSKPLWCLVFQAFLYAFVISSITHIYICMNMHPYLHKHLWFHEWGHILHFVLQLAFLLNNNFLCISCQYIYIFCILFFLEIAISIYHS